MHHSQSIILPLVRVWFSLQLDDIFADLSIVICDYSLVFLPTDVKDLISTLSDDQWDCPTVGCYKMDTLDSLCPSRVRAMLASRACRSSVMIGDPLGRNEMQKVVQHTLAFHSHRLRI